MRKTFFLLFIALFAILAPSLSEAQAPIGTPTQSFEWDQDAPSLTEVQTYSFRYYADGSTTGQTLASVTCRAGQTATVFICKAPIPAFTPGNHTVTLTARNAAGESPKSDPFAFVFVVTPARPAAIRIISGG